MFQIVCALAAGLIVFGGSGYSHDFSVQRIQAASGASAAIGWSAEQCRQVLQTRSKQQKSGTPDLRRRATERLLELYAFDLLASPTHQVQIQAGSGSSLILRLSRGQGNGGADPACFTALEPTDHFVVKRPAQISRLCGEGAPLVGRLRPMLPVNVADFAASQPVTGIARAVTAVAVDQGNTVDLQLYYAYGTDRAPGTDGDMLPLAADFTTPLALSLAYFGRQSRSLLGLTRGDKYFPNTGIYPQEDPTPDKVPLVLVHGLISFPGDFGLIINRLAADNEIRRHYQVWLFNYPTSLPVAVAAMLLREDLEKFIHQLDPAGIHPALHRAILVGHSMGGLLCRFVISDGGDRFYKHFFRQPLDRLQLSPSDREVVRRAFYYQASPDVAHVVFIATPHRGSGLAAGVLGNFGRMLLRMPQGLQQRLSNILVRNRNALTTAHHLRPGSSLDSLTPKGSVIAAINEMPIRASVKLHSIIGSRGRSGLAERSSDGVVPYSSTHLPQVESEILVPAGHTGTLKCRETADELIRISRLPWISLRRSAHRSRAGRACALHRFDARLRSRPDPGYRG